MNRKKKLIRWLRRAGIVVVICCIVYLLGPRPDSPKYEPTLPAIEADGDSLATFVAKMESVYNLKPGNEANIVWANDSLKKPTPFAIVYLHGFSASHEEGNPAHRTLAAKFGCNLYLSRLSMHGIDTSEQLLGLTTENYWESAKQALAIGKKLGQRVILMGTSTGGTQALQLAAAYPNEVAGLILLSPNIAINDPNAWLLNNPWGLQIARLVKGSNYVIANDTRPIYKQYWSTPYRLEAVVELQEMLESSMKMTTFQSISQPLLLMYYYKDEANQDPVVRVDAMLDMFEQVATPFTMKKAIALPNTGDHVIGSPIKSGDVASVISGGEAFMKDVLMMPVVSKLP